MLAPKAHHPPKLLTTFGTKDSMDLEISIGVHSPGHLAQAISCNA